MALTQINPALFAGATNTTAVIQSNGTTAITVDSSQNVGIGTTSPLRKFHVKGSGNTSQFESTSSSGYVYIGDSTSSSIDNQGIGSVGNNLSVLVGGSERMRINSSGYVTMPYQPMFSVVKTNGSVTGNSSGVQIVYASVQVNVSSSYNTGNGYFTAPIAGTYYFSAMGMATSVSGNYDIQLQIQVNGSSISISNPPVANSNYQGMGFACSCMATLAAGDSVRVVYYSSTASVFYGGGGAFNNFCGFLVG